MHLFFEQKIPIEILSNLICLTMYLHNFDFLPSACTLSSGECQANLTADHCWNSGTGFNANKTAWENARPSGHRNTFVIPGGGGAARTSAQKS